MWRVILIEDEPHALVLLKHMITWEQYGFTLVETFEDGADALPELGRLKPDLIITDIMMPEMTGLELLIEARKRGMDCRFIMLTCMSDFEYAQQALEYGASNYILKLSLDPEKLIRTLDKLRKELQSREMVKRLERLIEWDGLPLEQDNRMTDHSEVNRIIQYISDHYPEQMTLTDLASMVNMDASYVSDLFKKKTGYTITHFLQKVRVKSAIRYLLDTSLTIQMIAEKCGFANDNYFNKVFKRWTGETPSKFRQKTE